jgi:hypothetical protein
MPGGDITTIVGAARTAQSSSRKTPQLLAESKSNNSGNFLTQRKSISSWLLLVMAKYEEACSYRAAGRFGSVLILPDKLNSTARNGAGYFATLC